jgi:hypothetical protein
MFEENLVVTPSQQNKEKLVNVSEHFPMHSPHAPEFSCLVFLSMGTFQTYRVFSSN